MISRRTLFGGAALAAVTPLVSGPWAAAAAGAPTTLPVTLVNRRTELAAALNRSTLLANPNQPDATATDFYRASLTNHYARLVHASSAGGAGYAFPYDDVHADGYNTEGRVVDQAPRRLTIRAG